MAGANPPVRESLTSTTQAGQGRPSEQGKATHPCLRPMAADVGSGSLDVATHSAGQTGMNGKGRFRAAPLAPRPAPQRQPDPVGPGCPTPQHIVPAPCPPRLPAPGRITFCQRQQSGPGRREPGSVPLPRQSRAFSGKPIGAPQDRAAARRRARRGWVAEGEFLSSSQTGSHAATAHGREVSWSTGCAARAGMQGQPHHKAKAGRGRLAQMPALALSVAAIFRILRTDKDRLQLAALRASRLPRRAAGLRMT